eukprot:s3854_g4.t1
MDSKTWFVKTTEVFQKAGTSLVLMRKGDDGWSLVDLRGSTTFKWSLRSVELYHCTRIPPGPSPPPVGWACAEGEGPAPMLLPGKSPLLPFLKGPKALDEEADPAMGTSSSWVSSASRRAAQQAHDALEPVTKRPLRGPSGRPIVVANPAKGGAVPDGARSQPLLQSTRAPPGTMVNFLRSFRVVLSRPYVQVPWGYEWNDEFFADTGARVVRQIQPLSPLDRWNDYKRDPHGRARWSLPRSIRRALDAFGEHLRDVAEQATSYVTRLPKGYPPKARKAIVFLVTEDCPIQDWTSEDTGDPVLDLGTYSSASWELGERGESQKAVEALPQANRSAPSLEGPPPPSAESLYRPRGSASLPNGMGMGSPQPQQNAYASFAAVSRPRHMGAYTDGEPPQMDETTKALQAIAKAVTSKDEAASHDKGKLASIGKVEERLVF